MTPLQRFHLGLADLVLVVHASFVAFVIVGLLLIWIGQLRRWAFVRNFWFRVAHLVAIGVVAAESLSGFVCPLTTWEDQLRLLAGGEQRYAGSFIQHWLHQVIFFDLSARLHDCLCRFLSGRGLKPLVRAATLARPHPVAVNPPLIWAARQHRPTNVW